MPNEETPTLTVVPETETPTDTTYIDQLPDGISWPEQLEDIMSIEEVKELYTQIANRSIEAFTGTPTWILFQFQDPQSLRFGLQTSNPKPSNEALHAVLSRIVRELETIHRLEVEDQRAMAMQEAFENASELVDENGLAVLNPTREQKRHPEKFRLTRRQKRTN